MISFYVAVSDWLTVSKCYPSDSFTLSHSVGQSARLFISVLSGEGFGH